MDIRSLFSAFKDNIVRLFVSDVKVADNKITVTKSGSTTSYDLPKRITIDSELSDTSTNPVQNKAVKAAIPTKVSQYPTTVAISRKWHGQTLMTNRLRLLRAHIIKRPTLLQQ